MAININRFLLQNLFHPLHGCHTCRFAGGEALVLMECIRDPQDCGAYTLPRPQPTRVREPSYKPAYRQSY